MPPTNSGAPACPASQKRLPSVSTCVAHCLADGSSGGDGSGGGDDCGGGGGGGGGGGRSGGGSGGSSEEEHDTTLIVSGELALLITSQVSVRRQKPPLQKE